ncbi:hypothetical protein, partial [Streptomyces sp. NPDC026673]|uniref:hypothetical protein n=1 Tax=Streptomyces sp. NPDC026673 TaxID=3155724 RepID=UPI003407A563
KQDHRLSGPVADDGGGGRPLNDKHVNPSHRRLCRPIRLGDREDSHRFVVLRTLCRDFPTSGRGRIDPFE